MTVRVFRWDDAGAPVLSHSAGAIPGLLKACLVNGYNSQTVTSVTRSGSVAAVQKTAHGFRNGARIAHSGATQPEYNVEAFISVIDANTYTYPVSGSPATPATGTITATVAGAGWTNPFSATNVEVFRNGAGSSQLHLRVAHTAAGPARVVGYESMTDVNTGTAAFPTEAQIAGGLYMVGSSTSDSTARPWLLVATEKAFHLWCGYDRTTAQGLVSAGIELMYFFGDIRSNRPGDQFNCLIMAHTNSASNSGAYASCGSGLSSVLGGHYLARGVAQTGASVQATKATNSHLSSVVAIGGGGMAYPDPASGGMTLTEVMVMDSSALRGVVPGLWGPMHNLPGSPGDTFSGRGSLSGKSFILLDSESGGSRARIALETSDTW